MPITTAAAVTVARAFVAGFEEKLVDADLEGQADVLAGIREYIIAYTGRFPFMLSLFRGAAKNTLSLGQLRGAANVLRAEVRGRKAKPAARGRSPMQRARDENDIARAWPEDARGGYESSGAAEFAW